MGSCFSDVRGGQEAVGGTQQRPIGGVGVGVGGGGGNNGGHNDAVDYFFRARGQHALFSQIELSLSASKLRDRDTMSKSDPMAVVYLRKRDGMLEELGRTEVILNSLDPAWIEKISLAYHFETVQHLVFHVYDVDTKYHNVPVKTLKLKDQQFLGEASCALSEIVTKQSRSLTLSLHNKNLQLGVRNLGTLTVRAEESVASKTAVEIIFRCSQLENKDMFSKSDPFLRISRVVEFGGSLPICKTEVINNNLNLVGGPYVQACSNSEASKLWKSMADLEKLHKERKNAYFSLPASHHNHEKVLKSQLFMYQFCEKQL